MKSVLTPIYIIVFYLCWMSCGHNPTERLLAEAEARLEHQPDSALAMLQRLPMSKLDEEQTALRALLLTQASHRMRKAGMFGDTLIDGAVAYYEQTGGAPLYHGRALFYQGIRREFRGDIEGATASLLKARQAFSSVEAPRFMGMTLERLGDIYYGQRLYERALECYRSSYPYKVFASKPSHQVWMLKNIATCYRLLHQADSAEVYYQRVLSQTGLLAEGEAPGIRLEYAAFLQEQGQIDEADRMLTELLPTLKDTTWMCKTLYCLGCIAIDRRDYPRAEECFRVTAQCPDSALQRSSFSLLAELARVRKDYQTAVEYNRLHSIYDQQMRDRNRAVEVSELSWQASADNLQQQHSLQQRQGRWTLWTTVCVALTLLILLFLYFRHRKRKAEQAHSLQREALTKDLEEMSRQRVEERRDLRSRISLKERELQKMELQYQKNIEKLKQQNDALKGESEEMHRLESDNRTLLKEKERATIALQELQTAHDALQADHFRWEHCFSFLQQGGNNAVVLLLMQIQSQATGRMHGLHIRRESYLPLLREYAEFLQPGIGARLDEVALPANKQLVVCLLCAGITDNRLIAEAAALSPDTVRIYRKDLQRFLIEG